ncbi:fumarate reductase, flavoprotein subunit precursor [Lentilactobacillus farraginis DSM 18382 = JCM 14108]|nr:fumarate reductase, flavoprotein subunit precursor [Lentilactobacillus farraginis DSM 18382 = JCM 14108]
MPVPGNGPDKYIMHYYKAMHNEKGEYVGINEFVVDLMPTIKWYLSKTGQKLVSDPNAKVDASTGASANDSESDSSADAQTGASSNDEPEEPSTATEGGSDATTGASES